MRKVVFAINMSLDGCCDHTKFRPDEETFEFFTQLIRDSDVLVYGRKTYQLMVPYWPDIAKNQSGDQADNDFAQAFDAVPKMIVFSKTLDKVEGEKTTIVRNNLQDTVLRLKQEPGKNISIGGVDIPSQLMAFGLVDEYHFVVHPVIAGAGARLLDSINLLQSLQLKLVESKILKSGCVVLHYVKG